MTKLNVWFKKGFFSGSMIGVMEYKDERMLILDTDTITKIESRVKELVNDPLHHR